MSDFWTLLHRRPVDYRNVRLKTWCTCGKLVIQGHGADPRAWKWPGGRAPRIMRVVGPDCVEGGLPSQWSAWNASSRASRVHRVRQPMSGNDCLNGLIAAWIFA
jgi:hypothetical protein